MPKFSFPLPGRKHSSSKEREKERQRQTDAISQTIHSPSATSTASLSKAQRFFGTDNNLNIDSPTRDDESWGLPSSRSSAMSISISDTTRSTRSTAETGSIHDEQSERWDAESGVFPISPRRLNERASSTILGKIFGHDDGSSYNGRLRNEDSSSTLKSYYDRQTSPLAISQQTSESSARDLALRKGLPPVVMRRPLLRVEDMDIHSGNGGNGLESRGYHQAWNKESKKKPAKLDLSMLFPRARNYVSSKTSPSTIHSGSPSPSPLLANGSLAGHKSLRRKLTKQHSKESLLSQKQSIRSTTSDDNDRQKSNGNLSHLHDHYEQMPPRTQHMDRIPESRVPSMVLPRSDAIKGKSNSRPYSTTDSEQVLEFFSKDFTQSSPKNVGPWESSSAASISSQNTKASKRTSSSVNALSKSDLQLSSVLSLSSGSEDEDSDVAPSRKPIIVSSDNATRVFNRSSTSAPPSTARRHSTQRSSGSASRSSSSRKGAAQPSTFSTIPEVSVPTSRFSGPPETAVPPRSSSQQQNPQVQSRRSTSKRIEIQPPKEVRKGAMRNSNIPKESLESELREPQNSFAHKEKTRSSKTSISSKKASQQPTPPLSPTSMEFRADPQDSSRFMAVTQQEEALLEALRQKREKMREAIIEEHEIKRSPPRTAEEVEMPRISEKASSSTIRRAKPPHKQTVLLYLDTPISKGQRIDTAEPSPDLSDFLSFGSDDESTPRTSWVPNKGAPRPDSSIRAHAKQELINPPTKISAARLSAVGVTGFRQSRSSDKQRPVTGVRFADNSKSSPKDFLFDEDEDETDVVWGM